ncbi:SH3-like domain-containing protein [Fodinibius salinus]|uniref:SH3-like domain-containing protein n=1 Tax=Fodinibius salinus TaxID=860790 RepID=A0A5D3YHQ4_9BACT|nr:GW dipeptide domain-containing protein [Fodinibius salinus]TYP93434.1 SH3-like domain-containing protein [Fodinibius salinus]
MVARSRFFSNIFLSAVFFLGCVSVAKSQQPQAVFDRANQQLQSANYSKALSLYKQLEDDNTVSGALFLNMGVAYERVDSLGKAKYYLLKASRFEETESEAKEGLQFVESRFSRQSAVLPKFPWNVAVDWLRHNIGASNILLIGILLLNIGVILYVVRWFVEWYPGLLRIFGLSTVVVSLLLISCSFYTDYVDNRYSKAVMVTEQAPVLENPQQDASLISQSFEGYTFTVDHHRSRKVNQWSYVRMSNGLYGWIQSSDIRTL